ncbi:MMPL family transporter [Paractinoplanes hotanensis]|uniref:MMPL family transporter n=1 Tax=Paractinoplanes hotanensis TaxID=2906497 RepID=A0ABT0Y131_9ACTN|nr:MMPL family transporter [Actinoplanes hotanensis]MCM4079739.1 MMPL family transporter [Actinoplanes hotanensis]
MFAGWGSWVARFRWPVLSVALVAVISAGIWGLGVFGQLTEGGYNDPDSESSQATEAVQKAFGAQGGDLVVIYTPTKVKITDVALGQRIRARLTGLPKSAVKSSTSYWSTRSPQFVAQDKASGVALVTLVGADDGAKLESYREVKDELAVPGTTVQLAGAVVLADTTSTLSTEDLAKAEIISLPIVLILLLFLFGSLVAASLPVLVGGAAVLGSLGILHAVAGVHEVNSFAVNVASLLGLGMAIDYGLFMVGRFREEQSAGRTPAEAVRRTVATAGRTVVFSATLLMIALAGLLLFPQGFLKSLAYGGLAAVGLAALLSLTLLPALLAILGPRVDKLPIKLPGRSREGTFWGRLAAAVLRRPVVVALPILAGLIVLAAPIAGVRFGEADERTLPAGNSARQAIETLKADYPQLSSNGLPIVLRGQADSAGFAVTLRQIPGLAQIGPAQRAGDITVFNAALRTSDPFSTEAREVVDQIRSLPVPNGAELLVGGTTARNVDSLAATAAKLPLMVAMLVGATLLLMFFAFGSILLPIKAVVMSALSLSATFGVLVWIFQDGHGASWLDVTPAPLEAGIVVLMAAVVFGLSTDYEVFLLSRMVEARAHGASTNEAVTIGLARTGRVISAAAVLLIVVTGAFALSSVTTMRFVGVGMIVALLLDATVVRMLLVPAVLGLLGNAAWWAPAALRRLQEKAGLSEHAGEEPPALPSARQVVGESTVVLALPPGPSAPKYSAWDREAAGVMLLPPGMMARPLPIGEEAATQLLPKITGETPPPPADDDIVDAEIIEDDEVAPAENDEPDDEHVDAEIVDEHPAAASPAADDAASPAADDAAKAVDASPDVDLTAASSNEKPSAQAASIPSASASATSTSPAPAPAAPTAPAPAASGSASAASAPTSGASDEISSVDADSADADEPGAAPIAEGTAPPVAEDDASAIVDDDPSPTAQSTASPSVDDDLSAAVGEDRSSVPEDAPSTSLIPSAPANADNGPRLIAEATGVPADDDDPSPFADDNRSPLTEDAPSTSLTPSAPATADDYPLSVTGTTAPTAVDEDPSPFAGDNRSLLAEDAPSASPSLSAPTAAGDDSSPVAETTAPAAGDATLVADSPVADGDESVVGEGRQSPVAEAAGSSIAEDHPSSVAEAATSPTSEGHPSFGADTVTSPTAEGYRSPVADAATSPTAENSAPPIAEASAAAVEDPVADEVVEGEPVADQLFASSYLPEPYYPMPGVYRSESRSTPPDYSAPDDFFFAPSSAGTFASSLELPSPPESTVPYFGDRPDFESTRNLADLSLTRSLDAPDLDATTTFEAPKFEAPNRQVARTFEAPDPATSGSIVLPDLDQPTTPDQPAATPDEPTPTYPSTTPASSSYPSTAPEPTSSYPSTAPEPTSSFRVTAPEPTSSYPDTAPESTSSSPVSTPEPASTYAAAVTPASVEEPEPELDVTRSFKAPDLDATRRLQVPGLESTRQLDATAIERARRLESSTSKTDPLPKRPAPAAEPRTKRPAPAPGTAADSPRSVPFVPGTGADPLPKRLTPAAETAADPRPRRRVTPPAATEPLPQRNITPPAATEPLPRRNVTPPAATEPLPSRIVPPQRSAPPLPEPSSASVAEPLPRRPLLPPAADPLPPRSELARPSAGEPPRTDPSVAETSGRRTDLGGVFSPRRGAEPDPTPLRRPATLGQQPYSFRPGQEAAGPATPPAQPALEAAPPVDPSPAHASPSAPPRRPADLGDHLRETRPADLGDHLRESRPADLAQYSSRSRRATSEKTNRPAEAPKPARRPATLADQLPKPRRKPDSDKPAE